MTGAHTPSVAHTAGPWKTDDFTVWAIDGTGTVNRFSLRVEGGYVWRKQGWSPAEKTTDAELLANVALIATAPELLSALVALVPADFDEHPGDFSEEWHVARAAIAKATAARATSKEVQGNG